MIENLSDFYKRIGRNDLADEAYIKDKPYFTMLQSTCRIGHVSFSYRDFYKIALVLETGKLYYADKWIMNDRPPCPAVFQSNDSLCMGSYRQYPRFWVFLYIQ